MIYDITMTGVFTHDFTSNSWSMISQWWLPYHWYYHQFMIYGVTITSCLNSDITDISLSTISHCLVDLPLIVYNVFADTFQFRSYKKSFPCIKILFLLFTLIWTLFLSLDNAELNACLIRGSPYVPIKRTRVHPWFLLSSDYSLIVLCFRIWFRVAYYCLHPEL